jgi:hypothetical protein
MIFLSLDVSIYSYRVQSIKPGAFLHSKKGIPHACKNIGNSTGRLLLQYMPAGFENFFAEVGILIDNEETFSAPSNDTIDISKIVRIAYVNYGLNIIMPKPPD